MRNEWHYVYYSYEEWGRGYIGRRTSRVSPELDPYMGSFTDKTFCPTRKIVLATFSSVEEAISAEIQLHNFYTVDTNPHFANRSRQTSTKFRCSGNTIAGLSLKQQYERNQKISKRRSAGGRGFYYKLAAPDGRIIVTLNLSDTCRNLKLNRGNLLAVLRGERNHSKGWTICKGNIR